MNLVDLQNATQQQTVLAQALGARPPPELRRPENGTSPLKSIDTIMQAVKGFAPQQAASASIPSVGGGVASFSPAAPSIGGMGTASFGGGAIPSLGGTHSAGFAGVPAPSSLFGSASAAPQLAALAAVGALGKHDWDVGNTASRISQAILPTMSLGLSSAWDKIKDWF